MLDTEKDISVEIDGDNAKVVPVSESIKYRRRAQGAEKQLAELQKQLSDTEAENQKLQSSLSQLEHDSKVNQMLSQVGARDIEAVKLLVDKRMKGSEENDVSKVIDDLRKEKHFLFDNQSEQNSAKVGQVTRGVKTKVSSTDQYLNRHAKRAIATGSRDDIMQYLQARRRVNSK